MRRAFFFIFFGLVSCTVSAQIYNSIHSYKLETRLGLDNDFFVLSRISDRYYTFGADMSVAFIPSKNFLFSKLFDQKLSHFQSLGFHLKAYTPDAGEDNIRPYAGYLYLNYLLNYTFERSTLRLGVNLGVLGPASQAGKVQNWFHRLLDNTIYDWNNQIENEFAVNFTGEYVKELYQSRWVDSYTSIKASLGNINVNLWPRAMFRFGKFNPIQSSASTGTSILAAIDEREFFIEAGFGFPIIFYDATLQENFVIDVNNLDYEIINNLRISGQVGLNFNFSGFVLRFTYFYFSRELNIIEDHKYGRLLIAYRF
jgi:hypothetical protein